MMVLPPSPQRAAPASDSSGASVLGSGTVVWPLPSECCEWMDGGAPKEEDADSEIDAGAAHGWGEGAILLLLLLLLLPAAEAEAEAAEASNV